MSPDQPKVSHYLILQLVTMPYTQEKKNPVSNPATILVIGRNDNDTCSYDCESVSFDCSGSLKFGRKPVACDCCTL